MNEWMIEWMNEWKTVCIGASHISSTHQNHLEIVETRLFVPRPTVSESVDLWRGPWNPIAPKLPDAAAGPQTLLWVALAYTVSPLQFMPRSQKILRDKYFKGTWVRSWIVSDICILLDSFKNILICLIWSLQVCDTITPFYRGRSKDPENQN